MSILVGRVATLCRYPVKSLGGERVGQVAVDRRGLGGDRLWAVKDPDGKLGSGKSTRRFRRMPGLLALTAAYDGQVPVLTLPDGSTVRGEGPAADRALSEVVGRPVTLGHEDAVSHFDDSPVHLVTTAALRAAGDLHGSTVDLRRFRPNLVVDTGRGEGERTGFVEDGWTGRRLSVGDQVVLEVVATTPRCVMVDLEQAGLRAGDGLLRDLTREHDADLGVYAVVATPGTVRVGAPVHLLP